MMFERLKDELMQDKERWTDRIVGRIVDDDEGLGNTRAYCTETRWEQYNAGAITADQLKDYTIKIVKKRIDKKFQQEFKRLDQVAEAPELIDIVVVVEFSRDHNPTVSCDIHTEVYYESLKGHAAGYGYDKESTAVAEALNQADAVMKLLYQYKEDRLAEGMSDYSAGSSSGHDNRDIIGYGAGYAVVPYFEGAVGVDCYWRIFEKMGFDVRCNYSGEHTNFYFIKRSNA